jgi:hypothetical protein
MEQTLENSAISQGTDKGKPRNKTIPEEEYEKRGNCFVLIAFSRSLSNYEKSGFDHRDYYGDYSESHVNHSARCDCYDSFKNCNYSKAWQTAHDVKRRGKTNKTPAIHQALVCQSSAFALQIK